VCVREREREIFFCIAFISLCTSKCAGLQTRTWKKESETYLD
jgi:hypothetical protein